MASDIIYLNNAATSWPKPRQVLEAVEKSMETPYSGLGRGVGLGSDALEAAREVVAGFFGVGEPERLVFSANATDALNSIIHGFAAAERGRFHVVSSTLEHNAVLRPLRALEKAGKISITLVPFDGEGYVSPESVAEAVVDDTRLVVLTHGSNVLGTVQDIKAVGEVLRRRRIFYVVDAAQTPGHVPVDVEQMGADAVAFTGHKGLFSLPGVGGFYIRDPSRLESMRQGGTGVRSRDPYHPADMPFKFEVGTHNYPGIISLAEGVRFIEKKGLRKVAAKASALTSRIISGLSSSEEVVVYNQKPDLPIVSFNVAGLDNSDVAYILLRRHRIVSRAGLHCAPLAHDQVDGGVGSVRFSPSYLNTSGDCRLAASAVCEVAEV